MCAINPKRERHFTLSVYTSLEMSVEKFEDLIWKEAFELEQKLNAKGNLRWHVTELERK